MHDTTFTIINKHLLVPLVQNKKKENLNYEINKEYFEVF